MFKIESYITPLLMGYVDKYVKLRQEDFQISLWGGDLVLNNLDLRLEVLEKAMQLPIMFKSGHIHELRIHVPWTKLGSEPVVVTINTIECILKLRDTAYGNSKSSRSKEDRRSRSAAQLKQRSQEEEELPPGYLQSLMNKILNNVNVIVNNLILKFVEDDIVLSLNVKSAECYSVNESWNREFIELSAPDFVLRKAVNFGDLTLCLDKCDTSGRIHHYQDPLIYRCSVYGRVYTKYDGINAKYPSVTKFDVFCDRLDISLTDTQLPMIIRLIDMCVALYYGFIEFSSPPDSASQISDPVSQEVERQSDAEFEETASENSTPSPYDQEGDQGWVSWAWSYVPQILPTEEEVEQQKMVQKKEQAPVVLSIGMYAHKISLTFKLTEIQKEKLHYGPQKMTFVPFMLVEGEGISLEMLIKGLMFFNIQVGFTNVRLLSQGQCICRTVDEEDERSNVFISGGESLESKTTMNYYSKSLFVSDCPANQNGDFQFVFDWDEHLQKFSEQYGVERYGALFIDYLYAMPEVATVTTEGSKSSDAEESTSVFVRENSLIRYIVGPCHLNVSSSMVHRIQKFIHCAGDHNYEPYGKNRPEEVDDNRPLPTEDQVRSLEDCIPTKTQHLTLLNPTAMVFFAEHPQCDIKTHYRTVKRSQKKSKDKESFKPASHLPCLHLATDRFDLQWTSPMWPRKLIRIVSKIAGPSSHLMHHCHSHTQIKLFGFNAGLVRLNKVGEKSPLVTVVSPCSGALYTRRLLLSMYWKNTHHAKVEQIYELPQLSVNFSKASLLLGLQIMSSWIQQNPEISSLQESSLMEDIFHAEGKRNLAVLEVTLSGFELKESCTPKVTACTGTLSSIQVILYDANQVNATPILCAPANTSKLQVPEFFLQPSPVVEDKNDFLVFTFQLPLDKQTADVPSVLLLGVEGSVCLLDPALLDWFAYNPREKVKLSKVRKEENKVTLDADVVQASSPLNASQASLPSSADSVARQTPSVSRTQTVTQTTSHKTANQNQQEVTSEKSRGMGEKFAELYPLLKMLQVQAEIKCCCIFINQKHFSVAEPSVYIPQMYLSALEQGLSPLTTVVCLPHIRVASAGAKPISALQEIPIHTMDVSLVGDKLPWTMSLDNMSVYTILSKQHVFPIVKPLSVGCTIGVSTKYSPPSSDNISALGLCLHTDMRTVTAACSKRQVQLCTNTITWLLNLSNKVISLANSLALYSSSESKPSKSSSTVKDLPKNPSNTAPSVTSNTEDVTGTSGDLTSRETTPIHDLFLEEAVGDGIKLSLWLQWTLQKLELKLYKHDENEQKDMKLSLAVEDLTTSLDLEAVYAKVKVTIGGCNLYNCQKTTAASLWQDGPNKAILMSCRKEIPSDVQVISNKVWLGDSSPSHSSVTGEGLSREVNRGFFNLTFTRALCKNVKQRLRKINADMGGLQDLSESTIPAELYFHKYISELCVNVEPCDFVFNASAMMVLFDCVKVFGKSKPTSIKPPLPALHTVKPAETSNIPIITSSLLPLLYVNLSTMRLFMPINHPGDSDCNKHPSGEDQTEKLKTTRDHDVLVGLVQSVSVSPQADNPLPRYAVDKELYSRALHSGIDHQPGSAVENRQYQIEVKGLSLCTGCWDDFVGRMNKEVTKETTPSVQIPALEWNNLLKPSGRKEQKEVKLVPMAMSLDLKIVAAPAIVYYPREVDDGESVTSPILVCGHTLEINATSDLDFFVSTNQIQLCEKLIHQSVSTLCPKQTKRSEESTEKEEDSRVDHVTSDSGIGSDISAITIKKGGVDMTSRMVTSFEQGQSAKVMSPFDILLTAGRISCTVYSHNTAENDIHIDKKRHTETPSGKQKMKKSDLELKESSVTMVTTRSEKEMEAVNAGKVPAEDYVNFSFMNMHESEKENDTVIQSGSVYIKPFLYLYCSQPHTVLSCHLKEQKYEMSCYDILIKGPHNVTIVTGETKLLPDCSDFSLYWIETRAGQPHPKTGIPPSLYTLTVTDFLREPACVNLRLERPLKVNVSVDKLTQVQDFLSDLNLTSGKEEQRSKVGTESESSKTESKVRTDDSIEKDLLQGVLTKLEKLEMQTEQIVISMETSPEFKSSGIIGCVDKIRLSLDLDQDEAGNLESIEVYTYLGDLQIQTVYQKQSRVVIGPCTVTTDFTLEWYDADDRSNCVPMATINIASSLLPLSIGQENILCLMELKQQMTEVMKTLTNKKSSEVKKVKAKSSCQGQTLIVEQSIDDIRTGKFQYIRNPDTATMLANPGEIIFCSRDNDGNSSMTWCYNHPRVLSLVQFTPIPFNIPRNTSTAEESEALIPCTMFYLDAVTQHFVPYIDFELSENSRTLLQLPEVKEVNVSSLVNAQMWRVLIRNNLCKPVDSETEGDTTEEQEVAILPESLAASMRVDSCYIPSLIPILQFCLTAPVIEFRVVNHMSCLGKRVPDKLRPYLFDELMPNDQEFCLLCMQRLTLIGSHIQGPRTRTTAQLNSSFGMDVVEYKHLTLQKLIHPFEFFGDVTFTPGIMCPLVESSLTADPLMVSVGKGTVHTLSCAAQAWSQIVNPDRSSLPCVVFSHYVICNDTCQPLRLGQVGTDENVVLKPRQIHCYSWRSHKTKQQLHICVDGRIWKWCEPFDIDNDGQTVRTVKTTDHQYTIIVHVTQLTNVQKQVRITGQMMLHSCLTQHLEVKILTNTGSEEDDIYLTVGEGLVAPSYILEPEEIRSIKLRPYGSSGAWSHDVYVTGERMKESRTVKVLQGDNSYFHIWCHVLCHHLQAATQTKVLFSPLYIVRSHLPKSIFVNVDTPKIKQQPKQVEIPGQGRELQIQCGGSEISHLLTFQMKPGRDETSSQTLTLSTGMIGQVERSPMNKVTLDQVVAKWKVHHPQDWPYCFQTKDSEYKEEEQEVMGGTSSPESIDICDIEVDQLSVTLNVNLSEYLPGCNTLLVDVSPWCLMTNQSDLDLVVMDTSGSQWNLPHGKTFTPPKLEGDILLGVRIGNGVICSDSIPLSEEEVEAQRYRQDLGKILYLDGYVHVRIVVESNTSQVYFLTLQSSIHHKIRIITVLESICITNLTGDRYRTSLQCASPRLGKVNRYLEASPCVIPVHSKAKSEDSDLCPLPAWMLLSNNQPIHENESLVHYLSLQPIRETETDKASNVDSDWSNPVRLLASKEGVRTTLAVPSFDTVGLLTKPVVITGHERNGVSYFIIREDNSPTYLLHNLTSVPLYYGHHNINISLSGLTVQEETELLGGPPFIAPGNNVFYTPAIINGTFHENIANTKLPSLHFAVRKSDFHQSEAKDSDGELQLVWGGSIDCNSDTEIFVSIKECLDIKVKVKSIAMVTHVITEPISKAEVSAKEIRSRIKGKEDTIKQLPAESKSVEPFEDSTLVEGQRSIMVTEIDPLSIQKTISKVIQISLGLRFHHMSFVLNDESSSEEEVSEVMRLSLDELFIAYHPSGHGFGQTCDNHVCLSMCVGAMQVDNQLFYTKGLHDFPVVFIPQNADESKNTPLPNFENLSVVEKFAIMKSLCFAHMQIVKETDCLGNSVMKTCEFGISSSAVNIDDSFIFRILKEVETLIPTTLSFSHLRSQKIRKLPRSFKCASHALSSPIKIEHLCIHPVTMLLSVHASLKLFIASDRTPLSFRQFDKKGICGTTDQLVRNLTMHYATGALFRAGIVVGSLEILGNPTGLVRSIGSGVADLVRLPYAGLTRGPGAFVSGISHGFGSFAKNISAGMITSVTNFASSVSRNMDRLSLDDSHKARQEERRRQQPNGVTSGLKQGLTGFGMSILGAVAGLADQPIQNVIASQEGTERHKSSAATGIVTGMGKGIVGVFTKPIGGAAELVSQTGQGLLQGTGLASNLPGPRYKAAVLQVAAFDSSRLKYITKFLQSIPNTSLLASMVANQVEASGSEVKVTLLLTNELLILINCEDDVQQQAFSLAELTVCEKSGNPNLLTLKWRDTYHQAESGVEDENKDRLAAFLDGATSYVQVPSTDMQPGTDNQSDSVSFSPAGHGGVIPQFHFLLNPCHKNAFTAVLHLAKNKLSGKGFAV